MVSKGLLLTLAVCALAGFGCGKQAQLYDPCVKTLAQIKYTFDLSFDLGAKISRIFRLFGAAKKFALTKINGFFGGSVSVGSGSVDYPIPIPKNLGSALDTVYTGAKLIDLALRERYSDVFNGQHYPFSYICSYLWRRTLNFGGISSGNEYEWIEEAPVNYKDISDEFQLIKSLNAKNLSQYDNDEVKVVLKLVTLLKKVIKLAQTDRQTDFLGKSITLVISCIVGLNRGCGAKDADLKQAILVYETTFKKHMPKKFGSIVDKDIQKDYKSFCNGCVKKTENRDDENDDGERSQLEEESESEGNTNSMSGSNTIL